jgi:hypothetical protein
MRSSTLRKATILHLDSRDRERQHPPRHSTEVDAVNYKESSAYSAACIAQVT